jgi:hypothetical protein
VRSIPAGFQSSYHHQRRGQAHLDTNDETPETYGIERGMGNRVSRFGARPRAVRLVERGSPLRVALGSSDDDRSLAPVFPLSPLLFLVSDAAFVLKKARSSALPPRSPENNDHRPALALFPPTLPSPVLSFSPFLFASGHSAPYA